MHKLRAQLAMVALLLTLSAPFCFAQEQPAQSIEITNTDVLAYPQVQAYVAAPNGTLPDPATIQISEDNRALPVGKFTVEPTVPGVAVAVVIDLTRSMRGRGMFGSPDRLEDAQVQAIKIAQALNPQTDLMTVLLFNRNIVSLMPLAPADGGGVANTLNATNPDVLLIPDKPSGAITNDDYAYAALSASISRAIDELTVPQTNNQDILKMLPHMQKVVVVFSDHCDDERDAPKSTSCDIPLTMQKKLLDQANNSSVSLVTVGVGVEGKEALAQPEDPHRVEKGFVYAANWQLLQTYAQQVPNSIFFRLAANDESEVQRVRDDFQRSVIDNIVARSRQLLVSYTSSATAGTHELAISSGALRAQSSFQVPPTRPRVRLEATEYGSRTEIGIKVEYIQGAIASAQYYIDDNAAPIEIRTPPFNLDTSLVAPGKHRVSVAVVDLQGQESARTEPQEVAIPLPGVTATVAPPSPAASIQPVAETQSVGDFLRSNIIIILLITLLIMILLVLFILVSPYGRSVAAQATQRVTGVVARVTQVIGPSNGAAGSQAEHVFIIQRGGAVGQEYPITQINTYIGGDKALADIVLNDAFVSGRHASINRQGSGLYITDVGSVNGTYINGQRLTRSQETLLKPGDVIRIGGLDLTYQRRGYEESQQRRDSKMKVDAPTMVHNPDEEDRNN